MHEWGIMDEVIKEIIKQASENGLKRIDKVSLSIGKDSHLTPESIEVIFRSLAEETILVETKLEIKNTEGRGVVIESIEGRRGEENLCFSVKDGSCEE
ncbi:TPA: hypothetical protein DCX16_02065 [bacterium]|nr:hypothetical protein [bacterium]